MACEWRQIIICGHAYVYICVRLERLGFVKCVTFSLWILNICNTWTIKIYHLSYWRNMAVSHSPWVTSVLSFPRTVWSHPHHTHTTLRMETACSATNPEGDSMRIHHLDNLKCCFVYQNVQVEMLISLTVSSPSKFVYFVCVCYLTVSASRLYSV